MQKKFKDKMSDLKKLNEEFGEVERNITNIADKVKAENRDMNDDELRSFDELRIKRTALKSRIATQSRLESIDLDEKRSDVILPTPKGSQNYSKKTLENAFKGWALQASNQVAGFPHEYRSALAGFDTLNSKEFFAANNEDEMRGDGIVASPYGANSIEAHVIQALNLTRKQMGGLRSVSDVITTSSGGPLPFFYIDDVATNAAAKTKGADIAHTDLVLEKVSTSPSTVASGVFPIPKETLQDTSAPVLDRAMQAVALRLNRKQNVDCTTILLAAAGDAGDCASTTSITFANLVDLQHSVDFDYNTRRCWMMHQSTLAHIKKMENDNGDPIFQEGVAGKTPNTILDEPYVINNSMPELGANDRKVLCYGDFSFFVIHEVNGIDVQALYELYAGKYAVGILGTQRYDAKLVLPNTIKYLSTPSA